MQQRRRSSRPRTEPLPRAVIKHACPGRTRFGFADHKGNRAFFTSLCDAALELPDVLQVEARPATGSLIVTHEGTADGLALAAAAIGLFEIIEAEVSADPSGQLAGWQTWADDFLKRETGHGLSVQTVAAMSFFAMALVQASRGRWMPPAATALWYAIDLLSKSAGPVDIVGDTDGGE